MISFLLMLFLGVQIPILPGVGGTVSGTLKTADGAPAAGARVAAAIRRDSLVDAGAETSLISITQADENGRYTLENIPQGRYVITAGRVDLPTYYPGTTDIARGRVLLITAGSILSGIDFVMGDPSIRSNDPYDPFGLPQVPSVSLPVDIKVEGGGKLPISTAGGFPSVRLTRKSGGLPVDIRLNDASVDVPLPAIGTTEFQVTVESLPDGYAVKSLMYGTTDLKKETLKLRPSAYTVGGNSTANAAALAAYISGLAAGRLAQGNNAPVPQPPPLPTSPAAPTQISTLTVVLAIVPLSRPATSGVRITGQTSEIGARSILISGTPGTFYSDGSFEFRGVPAGRHTIVLVNADPAISGLRGILIVTAGSTVVVGDQDIDNVRMEYITLLPSDVNSLMTPAPANGHAPGPIPLVTIHGRIVEESAKQALGGGTVTVNGQSRMMYRISADGSFEIPRLFPGTYKLEIGNFGHSTIREAVVVENDDIQLELVTTKL